MSDNQTTDPRVAALPEWLRLQGRTHPEMDPAEAEWCSMLTAAATEIERLRRIEVAARVQADCYGAYPGLHAALKDHNDE